MLTQNTWIAWSWEFKIFLFWKIPMKVDIIELWKGANLKVITYDTNWYEHNADNGKVPYN